MNGKREKKVELLAPAGNPEGFYGAIHAGADAVYLGGEKFGARAYADNFTTEELVSCIRSAHIFGRKIYLTVNTLVKESEMEELYPYLVPYYEAGLDGVIVQDIGVFDFIREHFPGLELHVSTQMTLTGKYGANLLRQMGASRIVPARELSLAEIREIKEQTGLEVECFIHGAMCYCYSGQCLFSSILGGRSGNRGKCAQPCRLPYRVEVGGKISGECYPLSLKDMCTIEHIPALIESGIDSFKIEGRMKKPEYAAGVTAIYRKYIDKYYAGEDCSVSAEDLQRLSSLYIRSERQDGYYYRHNGRDMVSLHNPSYGNTDERLVSEIRQKYLEYRYKIPLKALAELRCGEPAALTLAIAPDAGASVSLCDEGLSVSVTGETVMPAQKQPVTEENIRKQIGKLGDTVFAMEKADIFLDEGCFYPLKALNELRRRAVQELEDALIRQNGLDAARIACSDTFQDKETMWEPAARTGEDASSPHGRSSDLHVLVHTIEQLDGVLDFLIQENTQTIFSIKRIYVESELLCQIYGADKAAETELGKSDNRLRRVRDRLNGLDRIAACEWIAALPQIIRKRDDALRQLAEIISRQKLIKGFLVRSVDGMGYLRERIDLSGTGYRIYTDAGFYIWNQESLKAFEMDGFCMPYELKASDQKRLLAGCPDDLSCEKIVYGYIPLMHTANCVFRTINGCLAESGNRSEEPAYLLDRYKKRLPVVKNCLHCMNVIYNCLPMSLHGELAKWQGRADYRVDFTIEDKAQTVQILHYFSSGCRTERPYPEFTNGHEKRGAE